MRQAILGPTMFSFLCRKAVVSVILAGMPLTLILAVAHRQESFSARGLIGAALAIVGIAILSGGSVGSEFPLAYLLAAVLVLSASQRLTPRALR